MRGREGERGGSRPSSSKEKACATIVDSQGISQGSARMGQKERVCKERGLVPDQRGVRKVERLVEVRRHRHSLESTIITQDQRGRGFKGTAFHVGSLGIQQRNAQARDWERVGR